MRKNVKTPEERTMNKRYTILLLVFILCICFLPGCLFVSQNFKNTRNLILDELGPVSVDTEVQIRVGPGMLSFGGFVASFTDADQNALSYLRDIRNVEVGVYNLQRKTEGNAFSMPKKVRKSLAKNGYEPMVRTRDRGEETWVMTKMRKNRLEAIYVIVIEQEELVLVEVRGRLERVVEKAIEEHGFRKKDFFM